MATRLSRAMLFELVWSRPRTELAKELGVSDAAIRKHCVKEDIPVPAAGYWARLKHGKSVEKPALPIRLPGHPDLVELGARSGHWHQPVQDDLNSPIDAPQFLEDIDLQVVAALSQIGKITASKDLSSPHRCLERLLKAEEELRRQYEQDGRWSFKKPRFDTPQHQRQLRILNSLALALSRVFPSVDINSRQEWVQGHGQQNYLNLYVGVGSVFMNLEFLEAGDVRLKKKDRVGETTLRVGSGSGDLGVESWADTKEGKIERQLPEIVRALLFRAEKIYRSQAEWSYQHRLSLRKSALEKQEAARQEQERDRLEAIAARQRRIRQEIRRLAEDQQAAGEIRRMVETLEAHPDLQTGLSEQFSRWREEALGLADLLDPMKRPLSDLLGALAPPLGAAIPVPGP